MILLHHISEANIVLFIPLHLFDSSDYYLFYRSTDILNKLIHTKEIAELSTFTYDILSKCCW